MKRTSPIVLTDADAARFLSKVAPADDNGCQTWTASVGADGRGRMNVKTPTGRRPFLAPRLAYTIANGPIPDGGVINQSCGDTRCVAPAHLILVDTDKTWADRVLSNHVEDDKGCWIWQGFIGSDGYGRYQATLEDGTERYSTAHRWAYIATRGAVDDALEVDHLCNVRACINPAHLEEVTKAENNRRRSERQTHCSAGHERTPENTYTYAHRKQCRPCAVARSKAHYAKKRGVAA